MRLVIVAIFLGLIGGLALWFFSDSRSVSPIVIAEVSDHEVEGYEELGEEDIGSEWIAPEISYQTYESEHGELPPSLEGTTIPFNLEVTSDGQLVVNANLRRLFDYFLTLDGEEPLDTILARIEELLKNHLPETAQARAIEVLHQYFDLKNAEIALALQMDENYKATGQRYSVAEMRRLLRDLRASNLDPEAYNGFFGVEDKRDDYTLARLKIQEDDSLTAEEKKAALAALDHMLPEADQIHLQQERQTESVYSEVEKARSEGASDAEIFHIREQAFGAKAAQRYAEADAKKAQWESRISAYRQEREEILNNPGITEQDKNYQIDRLRQQHFEGNELKRIPVIDRIRDSQD